MKPSDIFWDSFPCLCRGEAEEILAELVLASIEEEDCDQNLSDGIVCDALVAALNKVWRGKEDELRQYIEDNLKDEDEG